MNDPAEDVQQDYGKYLKSVRKLGHTRGVKVDVDDLFGRQKCVYTTPNTEDPAYVVVYTENDLVVFIMKADEWFMKGFWVDDQLYEMIPDRDDKRFIQGAELLTYGPNYNDLCDGSPEQLIIGLNHLGKQLKRFKTKEGRLDSIIVAPFVLYLNEGPKIKQAGMRLKRSLTEFEVSRLHAKDNKEIHMGSFIINWRFLSRIILFHVFKITKFQLTEQELEKWSKIPRASTIEEAIETIRIVYVKGLAKDGIPPDPRETIDKYEKFRSKRALNKVSKRGGSNKYHTDSIDAGLKSALSLPYASGNMICHGGTEIWRKEDPVDVTQQQFLVAKVAAYVQAERRERTRVTPCDIWTKQWSVHVPSKFQNGKGKVQFVVCFHLMHVCHKTLATCK
jgi:hypothetical protein